MISLWFNPGHSAFAANKEIIAGGLRILPGMSYLLE
jgi:hypothetical protein